MIAVHAYQPHQKIDPRWFQIGYLTTFMGFGLLMLNWQQDLARYFVTILTCMVTQVVAAKLVKAPLSSIKSALITALGLCLLLKAAALWVVALAAIVAIGSKFIIRYNNKHLFNPANVGIVAVLLCTDVAWVSPGQWGNGVWLLALLITLGSNILYKVGRLKMSILFLTAYAAFQAIYQIGYLQWPIDHLTHQLTNGTVLLFAFFMITDPMTTPNHKTARWVWTVLVALVSVIIGQQMHLHTAPIFALILMAPLTPVLDRWFKARRFTWNPNISPITQNQTK